MAEPTQSPLSGTVSPFAPHNTPEKSDDLPPPSHPLTPAARREPVRPVDGTSGWYAWTGEDLPRGGGSGHGTGRGGGSGHGTGRGGGSGHDTGRGGGSGSGHDTGRGGGSGSGHDTGRGGGVRNTRELTDERDTRDQVQTQRRDGTGQGFWRWFSNVKAANFTRPSPAGVPQPNKDNLQDVSGHTATHPEATQPDSTDSSSVITRIMRREQNTATVRRAAVAARVAAMVFCLVAFSVLAADRNKGWALDSYNKYSQFRYCESVNVIGFVYSGFQLYALVHHKRKQKHIIHRPHGDYFDFVMDQVLAYLLISALSSATARVRDWILNWGTDPFPNMANGSIAVTFMAFLAFAVSSLISAYNLFSKKF